MQRKPRCRERALMRTTAFNHSIVKENKAPKKLQTETLQNMKDKHVAGWRLRLRKKWDLMKQGCNPAIVHGETNGEGGWYWCFLRTSASHESGEALSCRSTKKCLRFGASRWSEAALGNISEAISKRQRHMHTLIHTHAQLLLIPSRRSKRRAAMEGKAKQESRLRIFFYLFFFYFLVFKSRNTTRLICVSSSPPSKLSV